MHGELLGRLIHLGRVIIGLYAIMADEATDGHTEHLAICVRYVQQATSLVVERFLSFVPLTSFDAQSMTDAIQEYLVKKATNKLTYVAQSYDGASDI